MAVQINIPKLGMTMSEATLVEWKAKEGDWIEKGSVVLEIETEKISWEVEAIASGFLHIVVEKGNIAKVGAIVGLIAETKEELEKLQKASPKDIYITEAKEPPTAETRAGVGQAPIVGKKEEERIQISPVARKMAEEHMIDITGIKGSGPSGRIIKGDIEKAIEEQKKVEAATAEALPDLYQGRKTKVTIPLKGIRKAIAEHMYSSLSSSAQLTVFGEFDATELVRLRGSLVEKEETIGIRVTYTEILIFTIARALKDHPDINCSLIDNEIKIWEDINIGVAIALGKEGLIVPVVKNTDKKSLVEISQIVKMLSEKAQAGELTPDDVTGGTFTLTSVGAIGVSSFQTPILNQPEAAILATAPIVEKPVVKEGKIVIASMMPYSLTFDHRVINGFGAELFIARLTELLTTPVLLLL